VAHWPVDLSARLRRETVEFYLPMVGGGVIFERVLMARRCRKRAAECKNLAETALTAEERSGHLIVAEHYSAVAEAAERSVKATLEAHFPHRLDH
jgi:hypothetical protein